MLDTNKFIALEKELLKDEVRMCSKALDNLIHDDFLEYSQSGGSYGKKEVLVAFQDYQPDGSCYETLDFEVRYLDNFLVQVLYKTISIPKNSSEKKLALRSSLWKKIIRIGR